MARLVIAVLATVAALAGPASAAGATADLRVFQNQSTAAPQVGAEVSYLVMVGNAGPDLATNVVVEDTLPANATLVSAPPFCSAVSPGQLECRPGAIPAGGAGSGSIVVRVTAPGPMTNTATVSSDQVDPQPADNTSAISATASAPPQPREKACKPTCKIEVRVIEGYSGKPTTVGKVTSSPSGLKCSNGKCTGRFAQGVKVTLKAVPGSNAFFSGWSGGWCLGTSTKCVVRVLGDRFVDAKFLKIPTADKLNGVWAARPDAHGKAQVFTLKAAKKRCSGGNDCALVYGRSVTALWAAAGLLPSETDQSDPIFDTVCMAISIVGAYKGAPPDQPGACDTLNWALGALDKFHSARNLKHAAKVHGCAVFEMSGDHIERRLYWVDVHGNDVMANKYDKACASDYR